MGRHDAEASGSRSGLRRRRDLNHPRNLTVKEAVVFYKADLLLPPDYHLPRGWSIARDGLAVLPFPTGAQLREVIAFRRSKLPPKNQGNPTFRRASWWADLLLREREDALARLAYPPGGPFNTGGRHERWADRDIDDVLRHHRPLIPGDPTSRSFFGGFVLADEEEEEEVVDKVDYDGLLAWEVVKIAAELMPPGLSEEEALVLAARESAMKAALEEERRWEGTGEALHRSVLEAQHGGAPPPPPLQAPWPYRGRSPPTSFSTLPDVFWRLLVPVRGPDPKLPAV